MYLNIKLKTIRNSRRKYRKTVRSWVRKVSIRCDPKNRIMEEKMVNWTSSKMKDFSSLLEDENTSHRQGEKKIYSLIENFYPDYIKNSRNKKTNNTF